MIQRIQSIFMLLSVLAVVFLFITSQDVVVFGFSNLISIICVVLVLVGGFSLFSYKNRKRQVMLNVFSLIINALLIALLIFWLQNLPGGLSFPEKGIEPIFPSIAVLCLFIANIYIRRDERLVKSVDRLR